MVVYYYEINLIEKDDEEVFRVWWHFDRDFLFFLSPELAMVSTYGC
jgi:hypothetical protein